MKLKIIHQLKRLRELQSKDAGTLSKPELEATIAEYNVLYPEFSAELATGKIFEFVELVAKVRAAQVAYFASRANKDAPKAHTDEALRRSKALEAELDKELEAYRKPPAIF